MYTISLENNYIYEIIDNMDIEEINYSELKFDKGHKNVAIEVSFNNHKDFNILIFKNLNDD